LNSFAAGLPNVKHAKPPPTIRKVYQSDMKTTRRKPIEFNASCLQIRLGWQYLTGSAIPGDLRFDHAARQLVDVYGLLRVKAVLLGIPNNPNLTDATALAFAEQADPERKQQPCQTT
jgi:hypothetical protein